MHQKSVRYSLFASLFAFIASGVYQTVLSFSVSSEQGFLTAFATFAGAKYYIYAISLPVVLTSKDEQDFPKFIIMFQVLCIVLSHVALALTNTSTPIVPLLILFTMTFLGIFYIRMASQVVKQIEPGDYIGDVVPLVLLLLIISNHILPIPSDWIIAQSSDTSGLFWAALTYLLMTLVFISNVSKRTKAQSAVSTQ